MKGDVRLPKANRTQPLKSACLFVMGAYLILTIMGLKYHYYSKIKSLNSCHRAHSWKMPTAMKGQMTGVAFQPPYRQDVGRKWIEKTVDGTAASVGKEG